MEKLDRLGWAEGLAISAFGSRVGLRVSVPGVMSRLLPLLPPGWKKSDSAVQHMYSLVVAGRDERPGMRRLHVLYAGSTRVARDPALERLLEAFEADLHLYIATAAPNLTFLHAGVVGWKGCAIVVPGSSFTGKTTLVREMLHLGATYYSDEFAVVDRSGLIHPFPRPLGIRQRGEHVQTKHPADRLGAISGTKPLPMDIAVICKYEAGARWRPTLLSRGRGVLELLAHSVSVRSEPYKTLIRLHKLAKRARFVKGVRGEAHEVAASILKLAG